MKTLELKNPIKIDGELVDKVTYDTNEIDGILFAIAESKRKEVTGVRRSNISYAAEFDFGLHLYMGFAAIVAVNPKYAFEDVERIKGRDVMEVMAIGRNFIMKSEPMSQQSASDEPTEITPESITPAPESSKKSE